MSARSVAVGDVWRTVGPCGWHRVEWIALPGHADYDGAAPGVCVSDRTPTGRWSKTHRGFVVAASDADFAQKMRHGNYERWLDGVDEPRTSPYFATASR